jgi:outer membrane protein TolC
LDEERTAAEALSPELAAARIAIERADRGLALANRSFIPDLSISAGVMPRGSLPPMWQATLGFSIPIFAGSKQSRAVAENEALAAASRHDVESIALTLRQRVRERQTALAAVIEVLSLYESGLLAQSRATAESTLAQYAVGRVSFASVLEAIAGYIGDEDAYLQTIAAAERIAIARDEVSLDPIAPPEEPKSTPTDSAADTESKPAMGM